MKIVSPPVDTIGIDQKRQFMETRRQGRTRNTMHLKKFPMGFINFFVSFPPIGFSTHSQRNRAVKKHSSKSREGNLVVFSIYLKKYKKRAAFQ